MLDRPQRRTVTRGADGSVPAIESLTGRRATRRRAFGKERPKIHAPDVNGDFAPGGTTTFINPNGGFLGDFTGDLTLALAALSVTIIPTHRRLPQVSALVSTEARTASSSMASA